MPRTDTGDAAEWRFWDRMSRKAHELRDQRAGRDLSRASNAEILAMVVAGTHPGQPTEADWAEARAIVTAEMKSEEHQRLNTEGVEY